MQNQTIVVLGASNKPQRFSNRAIRMLMDYGYHVIPVHPKLENIEGLVVTHHLSNIQEPVDTLTGMLSILCGADFELTDAAVLASLANRWSGHYADPSPATQVIDLIEKIPLALVKMLNEHNGNSAHER